MATMQPLAITVKLLTNQMNQNFLEAQNQLDEFGNRISHEDAMMQAFQKTLSDATSFDAMKQEVEGVLQNVTRLQKSMGMSRDEMGILRNAQNLVVEGLKNWQVELGFSVNAAGKVINAQGKMIEGLTELQQKMGYYRDGLENIYNAEHVLIQEGQKAIARRVEEAAEVERSSSVMRMSL